MQKDSDKPLGAEKHLLAGAIAGRKHILFVNTVI